MKVLIKLVTIWRGNDFTCCNMTNSNNILRLMQKPWVIISRAYQQNNIRALVFCNITCCNLADRCGIYSDIKTCFQQTFLILKPCFAWTFNNACPVPTDSWVAKDLSDITFSVTTPCQNHAWYYTERLETLKLSNSAWWSEAFFAMLDSILWLWQVYASFFLAR